MKIAEHNGQKFTTTGAGNFAALHPEGTALHIRARLTKIAESEYTPIAKVSEHFTPEDVELFEAPRKKEHAKSVTNARKRLESIAHLGDHETVYEKASWHLTKEAAEKAARRTGGRVVPTTDSEKNQNLNPNQFN